jgi:hypothetical protein
MVESQKDLQEKKFKEDPKLHTQRKIACDVFSESI